MPVLERQELLDADYRLSIRKQASLLQVSRNKKYYQPKGEDPFNLYLMKLIDQQYQRTPFFGVPRMTDYLNSLGLRPINEKRVKRLYKLMDVRAIGPNPYTSKSNPDHAKFAYLLRDLEVISPSRKGLMNNVNHYLSLGYELVGGASCAKIDERKLLYSQALVKYRKKYLRTRYQ